MKTKLKSQIGILAVFLMLLASCSLFQKDPVGASLLVYKTSYETAVRTAGQLYINGQIDNQQLALFKKEAYKVYYAYNSLEALYAAGKLSQDDDRINQISVAIDGLTSLVNAFIRHSEGK